jgi:type III pantothenate kinase
VSTQTELHIDLGNSRAKWRLISQDATQAQGIAEPSDWEGLPNTPLIGRIVLASVAQQEVVDGLIAVLESRYVAPITQLHTPAEQLGLKNSYAQPQRMGIDRWLAMLAAWYPRQTDVVVVDAGSALTLDVVAAKGQHQGGVIIPGAALSEKALLSSTGKVRFDDPVEHALALGQSTAECVRFGIAHAQIGAIESIRDRHNLQQAQWVFTGGAGQWMRHQLGGLGTYEPDLVLDGLRRASA